MAYQLVGPRNVLRRSDGACIPVDPENADYRLYLAWVAAGGKPDPDPSKPPADDPDEVTVRRLARALIRKGLITLPELLNERKD